MFRLQHQPGFFGVFLICTGLAGCTLNDELPTCTPVERVSAQNSCYDPSRGLTLIASGETVQPDPSQFTWSVFTQPDTSMNSNLAALPEKILVGTETIVVPDSILKDSPKIIVKVETNCGGRALSSMFFSFVQRRGADPACFVWQRQNGESR